MFIVRLMHPLDFPLLSVGDGYVLGLPGDKHKLGPNSTQKEKERSSNVGYGRVLLFSGIREVALYRAEVLRGNGFEVIVPQSKEEAAATIRNGSVDVVVLTYTLPNDTVHELTDLLREYCPACRLVVISESGRVDRRIAPDATVLTEQGPAGLIEALRRLTKSH